MLDHKRFGAFQNKPIWVQSLNGQGEHAETERGNWTERMRTNPNCSECNQLLDPIYQNNKSARRKLNIRRGKRVIKKDFKSSRFLQKGSNIAHL